MPVTRSGRNRLFRFSLAGLLLFVTTASLVVALATYPTRRKRHVILIYDKQKDAFDEAQREMFRRLKRDGYQVQDDSYRQSGSGDWRGFAALTASRKGEKDQLCYVEVQGFVSEYWMRNLPMTISHFGRPLDRKFTKLLTRTLDQNAWQYEINADCTVLGFASTPYAEVISNEQ